MLNIPYQRQQKGDWCGPAVLAMVLSYYGLDIEQQEIALETVQGGCSAANDLGRYAARHGFEVLRIWGMDDNLSICKLKELMDNGVAPIVVQHPVQKDNVGHYRIVIDVKQDSVKVHDPKYGPYRRYRKLEFLKLWKANGPPIENDNIIIIIRRPRPDLIINSCPYCDDIPLDQTITCKDCHKSFRFPRGFPTECLNCHSQWTEIKCGSCNRSWIYCKPFRT